MKRSGGLGDVSIGETLTSSTDRPRTIRGNEALSTREGSALGAPAFSCATRDKPRGTAIADGRGCRNDIRRHDSKGLGDEMNWRNEVRTRARTSGALQRWALAIACFAQTLPGCASNQGNGALIGGGSGAGLGALIGGLTHGKKGAVVGGAVGAAAGAGTGALIGHYMDKQEADLKKVKSANVERKGDELVIRFNSAILFDTGKAELKAQSQSDLAEFAGVLKSYPDTNLVIDGHTDSTGKKAHNKKLSEERAQAVVAFFDTQGIVGARMTAEGWADDRPVADNATEDGRAQNRRVEINIAANEHLRQQDAQASQAQGGSPQAGAQQAAP